MAIFIHILFNTLKIQQTATKIGCTSNSVHFYENETQHLSRVAFESHRSLPKSKKQTPSFSRSWAVLEQRIGIAVYGYHVGEDGEDDHHNG